MSKGIKEIEDSIKFLKTVFILIIIFISIFSFINSIK